MASTTTLLCLALLILPPNVTNDVWNATLNGSVTNERGAPVAAAFVIIHWDSSDENSGKSVIMSKPDETLWTDGRGAFTARLGPGFYDVFVTAKGLSPTCRKIRLNVSETASFTTTLELDPLVAKGLREESSDERPDR
jgi:hypothetical protein